MSQLQSNGVSNPAFADEEQKSEPATLELTDAGVQYRTEVEKRVKNNNDDSAELKAVVVVDDCSLACLRLKFLNRFRSPKWFLAFLSLAAFLQGKIDVSDTFVSVYELKNATQRLIFCC